MKAECVEESERSLKSENLSESLASNIDWQVTELFR